MALEDLYQKFPIVLQNIVCSLVGARIQRTRFNRVFQHSLKEFIGRTYFSKEAMEIYKERKLSHMLSIAAQTVPYYQHIFSELGLEAGENNTQEVLSRLPVMSKAIIKETPNKFEPSGVSKKEKIKAHTSGTTGSGFKFYCSKDTIYNQWAVWWRYRSWHKIPFNEWCAYFGGRSVVPVGQEKPPYWRYNIPGRQILFSGYHMKSDTLEKYIDEIRKRKPRWFHGYPSLLAMLAVYMLENNLELGYTVTWITIGAESLLPHQKELIKKAFGTYPLQHYGLAEGVANISQCEKGKLHIDEDFSFVELIPVEEGTYKIVGTSFYNEVMPFIRYDTGDVVTLDDVGCDCGRSGRVIKEIDGRKEDYIILLDGTKLGRMDHIFKDMTRVKEAQLYQQRPGELEIRIVKMAGYSPKDECMLLEEVEKRVGKGLNTKLLYIDELPRTKNNKLRFVISDINQGGIGGYDETSTAKH